MNRERLLEQARANLLSFQLDSLGSGNIVLPNQVVDMGGKPLWVQLYVTTGEVVPYTETTSQTVAILNHLVCVPANSGTQRAHNIAAKIAELYNLYTARWTFTLSSGETACVTGVEQMEGDIVDNVYSINVRITLEIYRTEE